MTGTIAQVRPADERLVERLAEEYRQARIDMGPREAAAEWFTPLLRKWRRLLAGKGEGFTAREQLALAVTLDADLRSRDTLIVTAISPEVSMKQLRVMVEERYSLKSTALLERVLEGWFHAGQKPDTIFTSNSRSDSMRVELRANSKVNTTARTTEVNGLTATSCTFTANW